MEFFFSFFFQSHRTGKLVSVSGTVIRVGNIKLQCSWMAFECAGCESMQCVKQPDGEFTQPTRCFDKNCHCRTFKPLRSSTYTQTFDWQTIRLQEQVPDDQVRGGACTFIFPSYFFCFSNNILMRMYAFSEKEVEYRARWNASCATTWLVRVRPAIRSPWWESCGYVFK